ncbi:MAG: chain length determinant protein EpsF [Rubrivivax sp.]|nr:chain length determinant protein EpsF [Rubrivivax sp.]
MTLGQFLIIMRARWKAALVVLLLTVGGALAISLMLPRQYTATTTVLVDQYRPDVAGSAVYAGSPSPIFMATQVDVLKSERVALSVVKSLKLADNPDLRDEWNRDAKGAGSFDAWLIDWLQRGLEVKPSRDSTVISITYKATDAATAARTANLFAQAFLETALQFRVDPARQNTAIFDARSRELRAQLEAAQAKLSAYQRDRGVAVVTDGALDVETARLNELSSQLVVLQSMAAESSSRQAQSRGDGDGLTEVANNPLIITLRAQLATAEAKLQELDSRLGSNHPQVLEARATIDTLRSRLAAETRRVSSTVGVTNTINRQREAEIRAALEAQRARVMRLRQAREEGMVLVREVEAAQRNYDAVLARLSQTSLETKTTQGGAYVLSEAKEPPLPSSPNLVRNALLAVVIGTVLAIAMAIVREYVDRRVRTVEELPMSLGLPLLGVLPRPGGGTARIAGLRSPVLAAAPAFRSLPAPREGT